MVLLQIFFGTHSIMIPVVDQLFTGSVGRGRRCLCKWNGLNEMGVGTMGVCETTLDRNFFLWQRPCRRLPRGTPSTPPAHHVASSAYLEAEGIVREIGGRGSGREASCE